jgi:hypothetical protein
MTPRAAAPLVLAVSVLALCAPLLWHSALPQGSDVLSAAHYLGGFMKAFGEGDLYPRWTDHTNRDLGAPSFIMFMPLTFYGAAAAAWLAGSITGGFKLYLVAVAVLSVVSCHALAREWVGRGWPAAVAAGVYLLLPYHVLDMYQRFALAETTAFLYFPLVLLFARRVLGGAGRWHAVALAASYAALVATHLVSGYFFSLFLGAWLVWEARGRWRALVRPAAVLTCGLLLAAPAVLPALVEKQAANQAWLREMPNGDIAINFIFRDDLLPGLGIRDPVKPPVLRAAHTQLALAGVALGVALAAGASGSRRRDAITMAAACAIAYLMQLEFSLPVWRIVPELATIQFPWRLQTLMVLSSSLLCGLAVAALVAASPRKRPAWGAPALGICLALNLWLAGWIVTLKPFTFDEQATRNPFVATWVEPAFTPVEFRNYRELKGATVTMPRAAFVAGEGRVETPSWLSSSRVVEVDSPAGGTVSLRSFWFPGWRATLDGAPLALSVRPPWATVAFDVPAGRHTVRLWFGPTASRRWGAALFPAGLIGLALAAWLWPIRSAAGQRRPEPAARQAR